MIVSRAELFLGFIVLGIGLIIILLILEGCDVLP